MEHSGLPPAGRPYPSKLFVEVTTRCNLGCRMCPKQAEGCGIADGDLPPELFERLEPAFPHLEALILNGIGEPLLNWHLEGFIRKAKQLMPANAWTGFQSNGLLLTNSRARSLIQAGIDRICLSMDASSHDTFRRIREGGTLLDLRHAFAAIAAAKLQNNRPQVQVGIQFVAMRSNLQQLPEALRWAADQGVTFAIVTHLLPYDEANASESLYHTCTAESVALFRRFKEMAGQAGLDIYRYFMARWKYARNKEEQRLVNLVAQMKSEAERRGLFLDMKKLLELDLGVMGESGELFAEAEAVARERGIDLQLPALNLTELPRCSFIEEGGAFVSWQGTVSPCYFLWHAGRCFASGWEQSVQPKVFGDLHNRDILQIWNDPAFSLFRQQVAGYGFADCAGCTLAPCDYVQTDDFTRDCHTEAVPCGTCLWSRGIFQCLH